LKPEISFWPFAAVAQHANKRNTPQITLAKEYFCMKKYRLFFEESSLFTLRRETRSRIADALTVVI
jgi:hypothetical protein